MVVLGCSDAPWNAAADGGGGDCEGLLYCVVIGYGIWSICCYWSPTG